MRGLRLFIRPIEPGDHEVVGRFVADNTTEAVPSFAHEPVPIPACGLLGKLLGEVVAVVVFDLTPDALRIDDVLVAGRLRRKWIGRAMFREVEAMARQLERKLLIVEDARGAGEFFRRVGFKPEGERWVRTL